MCISGAIKTLENYGNLAREKKVDVVDLVEDFQRLFGRENRVRYNPERNVPSLRSKNGFAVNEI